MKPIPQRLSLVSQTVDILRQQIAAGSWPQSLPGERRLCVTLQISRPTLRAALEQLRREGWLEVAQGRRRQVRPREGAPAAAVRSRCVRVLTPLPLRQLPPFALYWVDELRERLANEGFELEIRESSAVEIPRPERQLEQLTGESPAAVWILFRSTEPMQRWFETQGLPCLVTGSRFPGIRLPSLDIDHRSTCRHAAAMLLAKGHRRLALLLPKAQTAGDEASEAGFQEAINGTTAEGIRATVVRHDETLAGVCHKLDGLMEGPQPVTALLIARSAHALTALTHLQQRGVKIPHQLSLLCRDDDAFLDFAVPRIARYGYNPATFARRVSRIVLQLAQEGSAPARQTLLIPEFIPGDTLR